MKTNFYKTFVTFLFSVVAINTIAQTSMSQAIVVCGGNYGSPNNKVKMGSYQVISNTFNYFDSLPGNYTNFAKIDGSNLYTNVENTLYRYNLTNYTRTNSTQCNGIIDASFYGDNLIAICGYGANTYYAFVYDKISLAIKDTIEEITDETSSILVVGDTAYISIPGNWNSTVGKLAIVDLVNNLLVKQLNFGNAGAGIGKLFEKDGIIYCICSGQKNIITYSSADGSIQIHPFSTNGLTGGAGFIGNHLFVSLGVPYVNPGIGVIDVTNFSVLEPMLISGNIARACVNPQNNEIYTTHTDYYSYGTLKVHDSNGNELHSFDIGVSPEGLALDYSSCTAINQKNINNSLLNISAFPNPCSQMLNIQIKNATAGLFEDINIYDVIGNIVLSEKITDSNLQSIDISSLSNGIYMLMIKSKNKAYTTKFIKQ